MRETVFAMSDTGNPLAVWGYAMAALLYGTLAIYLAWRGRGQREGRHAAWAAMAASTLTSLWAAWMWAGAQMPALWVLAMLADVGRYAAWLTFLILLLRFAGPSAQDAPLRRWLVRGAVLLPLVSAAAWLVGLLHAPQAGPRDFGAWFVTMMLVAAFGLLLIEQIVRNLPAEATWNAKPVCLGLAGTFLFDLYLYSQAALFGGLDADAVRVRGLVHAALMPLLLLSASRHRNWTAKIRVSHRAVFHTATLALVGLYLLFIALVGYYVRLFGGEWGRAAQLALVFLAAMALLAVLLSGALRASLRVWLGKHLLPYRYDYREEWLKFTHNLARDGAPQDLGLRVIRGMADLVESPCGALWIRRPEEPHFRQAARWNWPASEHIEPWDAPLMVFMRETGWVVNLREWALSPERYRHMTPPPWLAALPQAWLLSPLWAGDQLLGFVLLGRPRSRVDVNWEVNDLLKVAGRQAASYLAQMQATESLLEARKFEAFSRMSAFVVHDLKNIVTQLSLMLKNAQRLGHNPEFQADMLMTVENSLERMRQLMLQLREGAAPAGSAVGVDLEQLADAIGAGVLRRGRQLDVQVQPHVSTRGHADRLERVIGHLVNNALDATTPEQRVWLKVDRLGSHARVEVGDQGVGMSAAFVQERLFRPFQTTKPTGMGIGAYESFQYVQELGGRVSVDSHEGRGTVITLLLPLIETFSTSDLQSLGEA